MIAKWIYRVAIAILMAFLVALLGLIYWTAWSCAAPVDWLVALGVTFVLGDGIHELYSDWRSWP